MYRIAFFVFLVAVPVAAQPAARGVVLDARRGPLAGARVELLPALLNVEQGRQRLAGREPAPAAVATTDALGRFSLDAGQPGVYSVRVSAPGKVPITLLSLPLVEDTELPPAVPPDDAGAKLAVRDAQGRAAAGLWVFAESLGGEPPLGAWRLASRIGRTAADGTVTLPRLAGEELKVRVFDREGREDVHDRVTAGELRISPAQRTARTIRVVDASRQPLAGVLVRLGEAGWPVGLTGADGRFALSARAGETLRLRLVSADGRQLLTQLAASPAEETLMLPDRSPLDGRVVREEDGKPVTGALVWSASEPADFQLTDGEGRYHRQAAAGAAWLEARAPGRLPRRVTVDPLRLGVQGAGRAPTLALERAGEVAGRVVDTAGQPVAGAWLGFDGKGGKGATGASGAFSQADGTFRVGGLQTGTLVSLKAEKIAFLPATAEALVPGRGQRAPALTVVLAPVRAAAGRIVDEQQRPVAGAEVRLAASAVPDAVADAQGRFTVPEIPSPAFDIDVTKPGFAPTAMRSFQPAPGKGPIDLGTIVLRPGVSLAGLVVDGRSRPIAGARVFRVDEPRPPAELLASLKERPPDAVTGADGRFSLADLPRGRPVHLLVSAAGFLPGTLRGVRPPPASPLRLQLAAGADLAGRVLDPAGEPVAGALLGLTWQPTLPGHDEIPTGRPVSKRVSSDREGRFRFTEMPRGKATLSASAAGFIALETEPVVLPQAPGQEKTVVLRHGATLAGTVLTTLGAPVSGVRVLAGAASGVSDGDGVFRVDGVRPGPALVEAVHPRYKQVRWRMKIEEGLNHLDISLPAGSAVRGRVLDGDHRPVPAAAAVLEAEKRNESLSYQAYTDADGRFTLDDVADGRYRLRAGAPGYADGTSPQPVLVAAEPVDGIEVVLGEGGTISGRLLGLASDELSQVTVRAEHESGASKLAELDAAGRYALRALPPGAWLVRASLLDGQRQARARVLLAPGGEEARDLRFGGGLTLSGRVLYRGEPLADAEVTIRGQSLAVERSLVTGYDGDLRFEDLDADTYWLGLRQTSEQLAHNEMVELTADRDLTIRLERRTVTGRALDASDEKPVAAAVVALRHIPGEEGPEFLMTGGSDASGAFAVERVPPGHYRLTVQHEGYSPAEREIEVPESGDPPGLEVRLQPAQGIELVVHRAAGGAPKLLHLRLLSPAGATLLAESRSLGGEGKVSLSTVPAGSWTLLAASPDGALTTVPLSVPGEPVNLLLPSAARLIIHAPALSATDVIASLTVLGSGGQPLQTLGPGGNLTQHWQLVAGQAAVESVPAGSWTVSATAPDGRTWSAAVATDGRTDVQVDLE